MRLRGRRTGGGADERLRRSRGTGRVDGGSAARAPGRGGTGGGAAGTGRRPGDGRGGGGGGTEGAGKPVQGASVVLVAADSTAPARREATTSPSGGFDFAAVQPGV